MLQAMAGRNARNHRPVPSGIALVGTPNSFNGRTSGAGVWSIAAQSGLAAGQLALLCVSQDGGTPVINVPAGFTSIEENYVGTPDAQCLLVAYKITDGTETSFGGTDQNSKSLTATVLLFSGVNTSTPLKGHNLASDGSANASPFNIGVPSASSAATSPILQVCVTTADCVTPGAIGHTLPSGFASLFELSNTSGNYSNLYVISQMATPSVGTLPGVSIATTAPGNSGWLAVNLALNPA